MTITVRCPICQKMFTAPDDTEGKSAKCLYCKEPFTIRRFSSEDAAWKRPEPIVDEEFIVAPLDDARPPPPINTRAKSTDKFPNLTKTLKALSAAVAAVVGFIEACYFAVVIAAISVPVVAWFFYTVTSIAHLEGTVSDKIIVGLTSGVLVALVSLIPCATAVIFAKVLVFLARAAMTFVMAIIELAAVVVEIERNTQFSQSGKRE